MKTKIYLTAAAIVATAMFGGCAKDGATGPAGPAGAAGANGSSNVTTSTYTANPGSWSNPQSGEYGLNISTSSLTSADNDVVIVYAQVTNGGPYFPLPQTNFLVNGDNMTDAYTNGSVVVLYLNSSAPSSSILFKIVVIPPAARMANQNLNFKNYEEVKAAFNLQD